MRGGSWHAAYKSCSYDNSWRWMPGKCLLNSVCYISFSAYIYRCTLVVSDVVVTVRNLTLHILVVLLCLKCSLVSFMSLGQRFPHKIKQPLIVRISNSERTIPMPACAKKGREIAYPVLPMALYSQVWHSQHAVTLWVTPLLYHHVRPLLEVTLSFSEISVWGKMKVSHVLPTAKTHLSFSKISVWG